ncbi:MAG: DUF424 domain-containing protein [Candidatus Aenigmarchaeota archaeon]|nr:DUF424 domain-containing protein [Candidatus Aenigmarchaeota archaeon]MDI6722214.1 DUF424 domain-containing protein [Candidatus Aenigmarchaeota archaeon]
MIFAYRIFDAGPDRMLAICDKPLIGRKFEEGELNIYVSEEFYFEKECDGKKAVELAKSSTIVNAVGEGIVNLLAKNNFIDEKFVLQISGVPHAQIVAVKQA